MNYPAYKDKFASICFNEWNRKYEWNKISSGDYIEKRKPWWGRRYLVFVRDSAVPEHFNRGSV